MPNSSNRYKAQFTDLETSAMTSRGFDSPYIAAGHLSAQLTAAGYEAEKGWGIPLGEGAAIQYQNLRYEVLDAEAESAS